MNEPLLSPAPPAQTTSFCFSVVIPALNASARIATVVEFARRSPLVQEVIVVDDGSTDETAALATAAGARVITSTFLGKGGSMADGLFAANEEHLLYLDGDLAGLVPDLVERMAAPFVAGRADYVKARFSREAGRVTTLTARPLCAPSSSSSSASSSRSAASWRRAGRCCAAFDSSTTTASTSGC
ncbi:MAG: glycosyltransferase [Planctomycetes bacterium]|nr:glycosyltransferase [Planctomycetota bacterium]